MGIVLVGGYFIDVFELIFGLVVMGVILIEKVKWNVLVIVGCEFFLIKLFGIGILIIVEKWGILKFEY